MTIKFEAGKTYKSFLVTTGREVTFVCTEVGDTWVDGSFEGRKENTYKLTPVWKTGQEKAEGKAPTCYAITPDKRLALDILSTDFIKEEETAEVVTEEVAVEEVSELKLPTAEQIEIIVNKLGKERLTEEEQELMFNYEMAVRTGLIEEEKEVTAVETTEVVEVVKTKEETVQGKSDELKKRLEELRIPKKYHEAIADISGARGCEYNVELNKGYVFKWGEISAIEYTYKEFMDVIRSIQTYEEYGRDTSNIEKMYEESN